MASDLFVGTLDILVLKAVSWGPRHGYAIGRWIRETTEEALAVQEGALYPALHRLDMRAAEFEAQGLAPDDARRAAASSFGDVRAVEAECVDIRTERERVRRWRTWKWNAAMDARYAFRTLRRSPLFTTAAVLTLAL